MSSSVFNGQIVGFLNNGEVCSAYRDVMCGEKVIEMTSEEFEFLLEVIFNGPSVLAKLDKKTVPDIMITTCKSVEQKKKDGMKEWASLRNQNSFTRRLVNSLEEVMNEDTEKEAVALQKALGQSGAQKIRSLNIWGEEPLYALQHGLSGLYRYPNSKFWSPKSNEMGHPVYDFSASCSSAFEETDYDRKLYDFVDSAQFY